MLWGVLALCSLAASNPADDLEGFRKSVRPLVRDYIFSHYEQFTSSELTFRDLKTFLANSLELTYDDLQPDEVALVIEDESDKIANRCDGGKLARSSCLARFNYRERSKEEL